MKVLLCVVITLLCACAAQSLENDGRFVQNRFAIGFWVDPPSDQITDARYKEIADANFTTVIGNFGPKNSADIAKQLNLCKKYNLMAIVQGNADDPKTLVDDPNCWGYFIVDEPRADDLPKVKARIDAIRKARPGKLAYFNLLQTYAPPAMLGGTYDEYVEKFADDANCDVLSMDYYPMMTPTADDRDGYCVNLAVMRKHSLKHNIPFWNFFNTMPYGPQYDPTESHLRWQIYSSLAYGAKGIFYFCYWTPGGGEFGEFPKGGAIITAEGKQTRHYDQAKRINASIKNLGPTLMKLTSTNVIRIKPSDDPIKALTGSPIKSLSKGGDYLVGVFRHDDGRRAVLLNNYDHNYTSWPTVEFDTNGKDVLEVSPKDGKEIPLYDDSPAIPGIQISLDSGEGRLFILPQK